MNKTLEGNRTDTAKREGGGERDARLRRLKLERSCTANWEKKNCPPPTLVRRCPAQCGPAAQHPRGALRPAPLRLSSLPCAARCAVPLRNRHGGASSAAASELQLRSPSAAQLRLPQPQASCRVPATPRRAPPTPRRVALRCAPPFCVPLALRRAPLALRRALAAPHCAPAVLRRATTRRFVTACSVSRRAASSSATPMLRLGCPRRAATS